jgi:pimeloyl-ACP methyl ester carboxylesterase
MRKREIAIGIGGAIGAAVALKMLTRAKTVEWEQVADVVANSAHSNFTNVDGARVHYQEFGNAGDPPVILIHGYTASNYVWKTAAPQIAAEGFRVIAPDLLGFGYSEKPRWFDYSIQSQARMIARLMNRLGVGRATIVGSSYGGAVAATLALDDPERVGKLVLVDAVCNDDLRDHPILKLASIPGIGEAITPFLADSKTFMKLRMRGTLAPENHHMITQERVDSIVRPLAAADAHHSLLATSRNWHANRIEQDAGLIDQPTLIIWGENDRVIPIANGYKLHELILHSRFVVLPGCGHVPQEEKSDVFSRLVADFCRDTKGRVNAPENDEYQLKSA